MVSSPLLTAIYNSTLDLFPGAVYCFLASVSAVVAALLIGVRWLHHGGAAAPYATLVGEEEEEEGVPQEDGSQRGIGEEGQMGPAVIS